MKKEKTIPINKMSKKARRQHMSMRRGSWEGVSPITRMIPNKKKDSQFRGASNDTSMID